MWTALLLALASTAGSSTPAPLATPTPAAVAPAADPFAGLRFLVGEWVGQGTGQPGQGSGGFTLEEALGGKALLRKNHADYPATSDRPAAHHEDLMVIAPEGGSLRATYWDSEGHVIHYDVTAAEGRAAFVSTGPGPRFRLTCAQEAAAADIVDIDFALAAPSAPDAFKSYLQAKVHRASAR